MCTRNPEEDQALFCLSRRTPNNSYQRIWIIRLQSERIIQGKKGLRGDNEDVNRASLMLIKENDAAVVHSCLSLLLRRRCTSCALKHAAAPINIPKHAGRRSQIMHQNESLTDAEGRPKLQEKLSGFICYAL